MGSELSVWILLLSAGLLLRAGLLAAARRLAAADRLPAAGICYGLSLLWPFSAEVWTQLGNVLGDCGAWTWARRCFGVARGLRPDWIEAWLGLGVAALVLDRDAEGAHFAFLRAYCLRRGKPVNLPGPDQAPVAGQAAEAPAAAVREHAAEQQRYLLASGRLRPPLPERPGWLEQPDFGTVSPLQPLPARLEDDFAASGGLWAWCDDLLTPAALAALLDFCRASTFWHHAYANGYLGAHLDDGMSCPLLYQIAAALQAALPGILADTRLVYLWAFKHRAGAPGVALHHDSALINVNFWLTPDSAHLDDAGGICVYPRQPPLDWDLEHYRIGPEAMRRFVADVEPICVPYRQNRAVIFNSRLFHATQPGAFAEGYANQRINVTLLFGRQPLRYHPKPELRLAAQS